MPTSVLSLIASLLVTTAAAQDNVPEDLLVGRVLGPAIASDNENSHDVAFADMDGDGDLDVLVANTAGENNSLYWNNGQGLFTRAGTGPFVSEGGNSRDIAVGDIDGDGDLDILVANSPAQPNFLYVNRGGAQGGVEGTFESVKSSPVAIDNANSRRAAFADIDGDGDLDLFVANSSDNDNFLYVNQGGTQGGNEGNFARVTNSPVVSDGGVSHQGCFGDIDNDGDLDLFVPNHGGVVGGQGDVNFLYTNDGSGNFTRVVLGRVATDVNHSLCAAFGDLDDDGDLDLFVGNNQGQDNSLYLNLGGGDFISVPSRSIVDDAGESKGALLTDIDADGDLDLLVANKVGDHNMVYMNDGRGAFSIQAFGPLVSDAGDSYNVAVGDLNSDGQADIMFANLAEPNFLYRVIAPQWTDEGSALDGSMGTPRMSGSGNLIAGSPFLLRIEQGAPSSSVFMVLGLSTIFAPFKGGVMVPAPDFLFVNGTDSVGNAVFGGIVMGGIPPSLELTFQAWMPDPGGPDGFSCTNAVTVITP